MFEVMIIKRDQWRLCDGNGTVVMHGWEGLAGSPSTEESAHCFFYWPQVLRRHNGRAEMQVPSIVDRAQKPTPARDR